jgi:hypothetical protein
MSKNKLITIILASCLLLGTASFVMGAGVIGHTSIKSLYTASSNVNANKVFSGKITYLGPWTNSDDNLVTIKDSVAPYASHSLVLIPGKGDLEQDCWITLNGAMTANVPISVSTDNNGNIYEVNWYR